jgi:hypothetical protein
LDAGPWARSAALIYMIVLASGLGLWKATQRGWVVLPQRRQLALIGAAALPVWIGLTGASLRPDGKLHIAFAPSGSGEIVLLTLPDGGRYLIASAPQGAGNSTHPTMGRRFDLIIEPDAPDDATPRSATRRLDPLQLAPHTTLRLADGVTLERLGTTEDWAIAIRYGSFQTLAPSTLSAAAQKALSRERAVTATTLLRLPGGETGVWPAEEFLSAVAPQMLSSPTETTYPPSIAARLTGRAQRVQGEAVIEVITDGRQFGLRQLTASPGFLH